MSSIVPIVSFECLNSLWIHKSNLEKKYLYEKVDSLFICNYWRQLKRDWKWESIYISCSFHSLLLNSKFLVLNRNECSLTEVCRYLIRCSSSSDLYEKAKTIAAFKRIRDTDLYNKYNLPMSDVRSILIIQLNEQIIIVIHYFTVFL